MGVTIKGIESLRRKTKLLPGLIKQAAVEATGEVAELVQGYAIQNIQSSTKHASGELASSVKNEVTESIEGRIQAYVWTDKEQGVYRELGTGPIGEASQKDLPPGVTPVYSQGPWFIPANEVPDLEALYGMLRITIQDNDFFMTRGQPARPWLYPALKQGMEEASDIYQERINEKLKGLTK